MKTYKQLSLDERYQIQAALRQKMSIPQIAAQLGRHPSTLYRELERNRHPVMPVDGPTPEEILEAETAGFPSSVAPSSRKPWIPELAHRRAALRRKKKGIAQRKITGELQEIVESKLRLSWSPEQICGRLMEEKGIGLTPETIYQHILRDTAKLGFYRYCLRFSGYKQHRFKKSKMADRTKERKNWIEDRPAEANERTTIGHWERDILLGKRGGPAILTMEDRRSRYVVLRTVKSLECDVVAKATLDGLRTLPVKTMTNDNGIEFQRDESLQHKLQAPIYFCNPYSPWERGSVENTNGLLRQYYPKGKDVGYWPSWWAGAVEETLNHRPRKVLGFRTPYEVFHKKDMKLINQPNMHLGLEFSTST